jgi:hypothetical protein
LARCIARRWRVPAAVEEGDLEQELWLGAWQGWHAFEQGRGDMRRDLFALYRARQQVQRWVNEQRNAARRNGKAPGRYPEAVGEEALVGLIPAVDAGQTKAVSFTEAVRAALGHAPSLERVVSTGFDVEALGCPLQRAQVRRALRQIEEAIA